MTFTVIAALDQEVKAWWEAHGERPTISVTEDAIEGSAVALGGRILLHPNDLDRLLLESDVLLQYLGESALVPRRHQVRTLFGCKVEQEPV